MREILFRGQTRRYGEKVWMNGNKVPSNWVYGGICQGKGSLSIIYGSMDDKLEAPPEKHVVYTNTVGQYTGLTDKNDKKIFEGDIVRFAKNIYQIVFTVGSFVLYDEQGKMISKIGGNNDHYYSFMDLYVECCWEDNCAYDIEVIGNIHDNPELLKGVKDDV